MATWLSLVNLTRLECGVTATALSTLTNVAGKDLQIKNWVNRAWMDIQRVHANWLWMRKSFSFTTTGGQQSYTPAQANASNFGVWLPTTLRSYITAQGTNTEMYLDYWAWEHFRNTYGFGAQRNVTGRPVIFSIEPNLSLSFGAKPDAVGYTITGDYMNRAISFVDEADVPALPDQFVDIIMHKAKIYYGQEEAATEVYQAGMADYKRMLAELEIDQLPSMYFAGALA